MSFEALTKEYQSINVGCGRWYGYLYHRRIHEVKDLLCDNWVCDRCRPIKKMILCNNIARCVKEDDMNYHFVITCDGKEWREKYSWDESYAFMSEVWHNYSRVIKYHYGKDLKYIVLPRAQKTGYCHYHILLDRYVPISFLDRYRMRYGLGYVSIMYHDNPQEYLTHFKKDYEYFIPKNKKHYMTTKNIKINDSINDKKSDDLLFFQVDKKNVSWIDDMYEIIKIQSGYPLPFNMYIRRMDEIVPKT